MTVPLLLLGRASSALLRLASKTANGSLLFTECVLGIRPPLATTQADIDWRSERRATNICAGPARARRSMQSHFSQGSGESQGRAMLPRDPPRIGTLSHQVRLAGWNAAS